MSEKLIEKKDVPWWLSIYNLFVGLIYITISMVILALLNFNIQILLDLLTLILILIGISRVLNGIFANDPRIFLRILKFILGVGIIILSSFIFHIRDIDYSLQITLLAVGILINSTLRIVVGFLDKSEAKWYRIVLIIIGSITLVISILFLIFPAWSMKVYIILLTVSFILNGLVKLNYAFKAFEKKERILILR